ncbi:hypothetical protein, partial [Cronobacter sakazakii]|uniref:hypothetical protein n=1 Tax=Cronobacter sakazakii TaxID=28141 RepID=UPI001F17A85C
DCPRRSGSYHIKPRLFHTTYYIRGPEPQRWQGQCCQEKGSTSERIFSLLFIAGVCAAIIHNLILRIKLLSFY